MSIDGPDHDPYVAAFPEIRAFWDGTARGELLLPRCTRCAQTHWYPRATCPFCRCATMRWEPASGRATLHTFTIVRRPEAPYVLAYVALAEGPLMLTNVVECGVDALHIDMPLRAVFRPTAEGRLAPVFRPA